MHNLTILLMSEKWYNLIYLRNFDRKSLSLAKSVENFPHFSEMHSVGSQNPGKIFLKQCFPLFLLIRPVLNDINYHIIYLHYI